MKKRSYKTDQSLDPARLADDAVFALSSLQRTSKANPELLMEGMKVCDYLLRIFRELQASGVKRELEGSRQVSSDWKALEEGVNDIAKASRKTEEVKRMIGDLIDNPLSHTSEEIESIKEHLISITMPIWRHRASEFRERKMKRSLVLHV